MALSGYVCPTCCSVGRGDYDSTPFQSCYAQGMKGCRCWWVRNVRIGRFGIRRKAAAERPSGGRGLAARRGGCRLPSRMSHKALQKRTERHHRKREPEDEDEVKWVCVCLTNRSHYCSEATLMSGLRLTACGVTGRLWGEPRQRNEISLLLVLCKQPEYIYIPCNDALHQPSSQHSLILYKLSAASSHRDLTKRFSIMV